MILSAFLLRNWAELDGMRADRGTPSILTLTARRGLNWAYYIATRYMEEAKRKEFDESLEYTLEQWTEMQFREALQQEIRRQQLIHQMAEVQK